MLLVSSDSNASEWEQPPDGKAIYQYYCYQCHAYSGNAKTLASVYLSPKPRDFTSMGGRQLTTQQMRTAISQGRRGTAMVAFSDVLTAPEIDAVIQYVKLDLTEPESKKLAYHSTQNGWANHQKYQAAFPFVNGVISLNKKNLNTSQQSGKKLYMTDCVSCHDQPFTAQQKRLTWEKIQD